MLVFSALLAASVGCGDSETVTVAGKVMIDGQPAKGGRLSLIPLSKDGHRAYSGITDAGEYYLQTQDGIKGVYPGSYEVTLLQDLDEAERKKLLSVSRGRIEPEEVRVRYSNPNDAPFTVPESDNEDLTIEIDTKAGWQKSLNE